MWHQNPQLKKKKKEWHFLSTNLQSRYPYQPILLRRKWRHAERAATYCPCANATLDPVPCTLEETGRQGHTVKQNRCLGHVLRRAPGSLLTCVSVPSVLVKGGAHAECHLSLRKQHMDAIIKRGNVVQEASCMAMAVPDGHKEERIHVGQSVSSLVY